MRIFQLLTVQILITINLGFASIVNINKDFSQESLQKLNEIDCLLDSHWMDIDIDDNKNAIVIKKEIEKGIFSSNIKLVSFYWDGQSWSDAKTITNIEKGSYKTKLKILNYKSAYFIWQKNNEAIFICYWNGQYWSSPIKTLLKNFDFDFQIDKIGNAILLSESYLCIFNAKLEIIFDEKFQNNQKCSSLVKDKENNLVYISSILNSEDVYIIKSFSWNGSFWQDSIITSQEPLKYPDVYLFTINNSLLSLWQKKTSNTLSSLKISVCDKSNWSFPESIANNIEGKKDIGWTAKATKSQLHVIWIEPQILEQYLLCHRIWENNNFKNTYVILQEQKKSPPTFLNLKVNDNGYGCIFWNDHINKSFKCSIWNRNSWLIPNMFFPIPQWVYATELNQQNKLLIAWQDQNSIGENQIKACFWDPQNWWSKFYILDQGDNYSNYFIKLLEPEIINIGGKMVLKWSCSSKGNDDIKYCILENEYFSEPISINDNRTLHNNL